MKKRYFLNSTLSFILLLSFSAGSGQNLIVNPSAEGGTAPTSNGWTAAQSNGTSCYTGSGWRIQGAQQGFPAAQQGSYIFFPGCGGAGTGNKYELYQTINVASNAAAIDAGGYTVTFSGYMSSFNQSPADQTEMIVEFRDASTAVLGSYTTGTVANTGGWVQHNHSQAAPSGTRTIRIRLISTSRNGSSIDSYFDNLSLTATSTLPVHFISFTATLATSGSLLKWETSDEINNRGFYIERSANGITWETIGFIPATAGGGGSHQYQFTDAKPATGINHYKLKQADLDGKYEYSVIRNVQYQYSGGTSVFPNPADNLLSIVTQENNFKAQIIKPDGKVVATFVNQKNVPIRHLPSGIYYLRLMNGDKVENLKFLKR